MLKRDWSQCKALVTGASSGIGEAICKQLAERGASVLATARREERLRALSELQGLAGRIHYIAGDITSPEHRATLAAWIEREWGALDILINNAGSGAIGRFDEASSDRLRKIMEVDFFASVELTRICLPLMRSGVHPTILNIGSVLSHVAVPLKSEYCAAKFALRGWAESIRTELASQGIHVLMLSPSTTKSEFFTSLIDTSPNAESKSFGAMSPEKVAQAAIRSLERRRRDAILSLGGKALVWCGRLVPGILDRVLRKSTTK
ncbi:MAG: SDR family NAD(P)-dependent oxidoreductase [Pirellula sp.]|jgi:short-subunit dehydrogenase